MNHYERLKVSQDAPPEVIRAAYRALAAKLHPDRQQGVTTGPDDVVHSQMAALNQAYEVLIDPKLRQDYDATLAPARARVNEEPELDSLSPESAQGPSTRVDMDWLVPKPPASSLHWPPSRPMMIFGGGAVAVVTLAIGGWVWQMQGQHQMERALSKQYASAHEGEEAPDAAVPVPPTAAVDPNAAEKLIERELAAVSKESTPRGGAGANRRRRPTADELSRMSDDELLRVLPTLDNQDGSADKTTAQIAQQQARRTPGGSARASSHHPLDGKPLNLRTDTRIVESLPPSDSADSKKNR